MLESTGEGIGTRGIVVQGPMAGLGLEEEAFWKVSPQRANVPFLSSNPVRYAVWLQESCSLRVLRKLAGVLLRRLNIPPRPIANK